MTHVGSVILDCNSATCRTTCALQTAWSVQSMGPDILWIGLHKLQIYIHACTIHLQLLTIDSRGLTQALPSNLC